jgi:hypothetical protein
MLTLRRLEMATPIMQLAKDEDPAAFVRLAAIAMADDATLKLAAAGNEEPLQAFIDKAYDMPSEEAAEILSFFTQASQRFTLRLSGLSPEEVNQVMAQALAKLKKTLDLGSPADSPAQLEATPQP